MRYWLPYVLIEHNGFSGSQSDERQGELLQQYEQYFDSIKASLPPDILKFGDRKNSTLYLNDSEVRAIQSDFSDCHVDIVLEGEARDQSGRIVGSRLFTLSYHNVSEWEYKGKSSGLAGLDGDHLFDEIQILPNGLVQHRMYFSGDIEIIVRFSGFSLEYTDSLYEPYS